jgi:RNA-binding protein YhbY
MPRDRSISDALPAHLAIKVRRLASCRQETEEDVLAKALADLTDRTRQEMIEKDQLYVAKPKPFLRIVR